MTDAATRVSPRWLALREPSDAEARAPELAEHVARALASTGCKVIHDLGSGTGSMGRWLAPRLAGPQHWVMHDRDGDLLALAGGELPGPAADGAPVTVEARQTDITRLNAGELAGASLITASALLDMLTGDELSALAAVLVRPQCPILLTLSVTGDVELAPADPLDRRVAAAFDAHQRRTTQRGRLLGPDAVDFAARAFTRLEAEVLVGPSPWRLGASERELAAAWFRGWLGAACEQQEELGPEAGAYRHRRLAQAAAGRLAVRVGHADLLVLPRRAPASAGVPRQRAARPSGLLSARGPLAS